MTNRDKEIALVLKERLSKVVRLLDFKIYGSRAREDADEYSDMDVFLVVESLDKELKEKVFDIIWEVGYENFLVISPITFTRDELLNTPLRSSSLVKNIREEGIRI